MEGLPLAVDGDRVLAAWLAAGAVVVAAVGFILYSFVGTFVFALFLYYATRPIYRRIRRRIRPPGLAAATSLFILALPVLALVGFVVLLGIREATTFASQSRLNVVGIETRTYIYLQPYLNILQSPFQLLTSPEQLSSLREVVGGVRPFLGTMGNALLHAFIMVGIAFYLLRDDRRLSTWMRERFADDRGVVEEYLDAVDYDYHQVFFGNILNAVLTGLIGALVYSALDFVGPAGVDVPAPVFLGLLSGAASLVPLVGMKLVYVPATVYLLGLAFLEGRLDALWFPVAFGLVSFLVVDVIPDLVLRPYVSGRDLHVGMVMFAYILGPLLFGWYGIFLGPMILVAVVHFAEIVLPDIFDRLPPGAQSGGTARRSRPPIPFGDREAADPEAIAGEGGPEAVTREGDP